MYYNRSMKAFLVIILALALFTGAKVARAQYTLPQQLPQVYQNYNAWQAQAKYLEEQKKQQQANQQSVPAPENSPAAAAPQPPAAQAQSPAESQPVELVEPPTGSTGGWVRAAIAGVLIIAIGLARYYLKAKPS